MPRSISLLVAAVSAIAGASVADLHAIQWTGRPDDPAFASNNTRSLNAALAMLEPGSTLVIPNRTFWLAGGVRATGLINATVRLDGTLRFLAGRKGWPTEPCGANRTCVVKAILLENVRGLTLASGGAGWASKRLTGPRNAHSRDSRVHS